MKKLLSLFLCTAMLTSSLSSLWEAAALSIDFGVESAQELPAEDAAADAMLKSADGFIVASPNVNMTEGAKEPYAVTILRGGESLDAASVRLTILDISAQYGKDYVIRLPEGGRLFNEAGASSLLSAFSEDGGKLKELNGLDEIQALGKTGEELQAIYDEDMQRLSDDLSEELQNYVAEKAEETGRSGGEIIAEANKAAGSLSSAFERAAGLADDSAPMDGGSDNAAGILNAYTNDKLSELAKKLDGPYVILDFAAGETEKTVGILPIDNDTADGDRMFLAQLYPESAGAVIGSVKGVTAVIEDDEVWEKPTVAFAESRYYPENGFCDVTIRRDGVLSGVSAVKLTTADGTALGGRDYSQVDTTVVFPFGVGERTVKVPVNSDYINEEVTFTLSLSDAINCSLDGARTATGFVEADSVSYRTPTEEDTAMLLEEYGVSDVYASDKEAVNHLKPFYTYTRTKYGYARAENDVFKLHPEAASGERGTYVGGNWTPKDGNTHYDYDGYQIEWTKESGAPCWSSNEVSIYYDGAWHTVWENTKERWSKGKTNIYPRKNAFSNIAVHVSHSQASFHAPTLTIHAIRPILRPFEITYMEAEPLVFRNRDGDYVSNDLIPELMDATSASLQDADSNDTVVRFSGDSVTVNTTSRFGYIAGLRIVNPTTGKSKLVKSGLSSSNTSVSLALNNDFIRQNLEYINFVSNGSDRIKGQFKVQPVFDYYDAVITTHNDKKATIYVNNFAKEDEDAAQTEDGTVVGTYKIFTPKYNPGFLLAPHGLGGKAEKIWDQEMERYVAQNTAPDDWEIKNFVPTLLWNLIDMGNGTYKLQNTATGGFLTATRDTPYLFVNKYNGSKDQLLKIQKLENGNVIITLWTWDYLRGLDMLGSSPFAGGRGENNQLTLIEATPGEIDAAWKLADELAAARPPEDDPEPAPQPKFPRGIYHIRSRNYGYFTAHGLDAEVSTLYRFVEDASLWKVYDRGDGWYKIIDTATGGALTVQDGSDGAHLIVSKDLEADSQRFKLVDAEVGNYRFIYTKASGGEKKIMEYLGTKELKQESVMGNNMEEWFEFVFVEDDETVPEPETDPETGVVKDSVVRMHRGDTVTFTQIINKDYKIRYNSSRIRLVKRKTSDGEELDDNSKYNLGKSSYNLFCDFTNVDAYVHLDKKTNQVIVRMAKNDVKKFDQKSGIFTCPYADVGNYREYTVVSPDDFSLNSYVTLEANALGSRYTAVWEPAGDYRKYAQSTFFFETEEEYEDNIITLSCEKADERRYSVGGTAYYSEVSLASQVEGAAWRPAAGLLVSFGKNAYGISGENGRFATLPANGIKGDYVICKTEGMGRTRYRTLLLNDAVTAETDNGNGGTDTVNVVSMGNITVSVTDSTAPYASTFTAADANGVIGGNVAKINDDVATFKVSVINNNAPYEDADGVTRTEKVKKVEFVVYDYQTNTEKSVIEGEAQEISGKRNISVWQLTKTLKKNESHLYAPSDRIYVRVTTDRVKGNGKAYDENGEPVYLESLNETTYPDVNTGYTFASTGTEKPVTQDIDLFNESLDQFLTLPVIGSMNSTFIVKGIALSVSQLPEGGVRLGIGYAFGTPPAQPDDEVFDASEHKVPFTPDRIKHEISQAGEWGEMVGPKNAVGFKGGGIYPMFGIYLDFGFKTTTHLDTEHSSETDFEFLGGGAMLGATGNYRLVIYGAIGPVPVYFGVDGTLSVFANIGFKLKNESTLGDGATELKGVTFRDIKSGDKKIEDEVLFDFALQAHGLLNVYVGAGIAGTFGVRGGASVNASFIYYPTITEIYDINPVGLRVSVGLKFWVDLVLLSVPSPELKLVNENYGYFKDINELNENNSSLLSAASSEIETDKYGAFLRNGSGSKETWLPDGDAADLMSTFEMRQTTVLSEDGYEHASAQLADLGGGRILLVFLANDPEKGDYDRTSIVYSVYDNGEWTAPVKIDPSSRKGDFEPHLCDVGDKVLVSWTSRNNDNEQTDALEYLKGMNVFAATIDKATTAVGEIVQLTDDDYYNSHPVGLYDEKSGDYIVYYLKAEVTEGEAAEDYADSVEDAAGANLLTVASPTTNGAKLMYMLHDSKRGWMTTDEKLSENEILAEGWHGQRFVVSEIRELAGSANSISPRIIDFDAVCCDGKGLYAYTIDLDNNIDTMADRELYVQLYDFAEHKTYKPIRITNDNLADTSPQLVKNSFAAYLFWRQGEDTVRYISVTNLMENGLEDNETLKETPADEETPVYEIEQSVVFSAMEDPGMKPSFANYKVFVDEDDNMFIAWTQGEELTQEDGTVVRTAQEVYASAFITETGGDAMLESSWSEGMRLTETGRYNDGIAVWTDQYGNLITVNNQYDIDYDSSEAVNIKLVATAYRTVGSAEVSDVRFYDRTPLAGTANPVTIDVKNKGLKPMTGFTVKAYEVRNGTAGDEPVFALTSEERVPPSSVIPVSFDWQMPDSYEDIESLSLYITVEETGYDKISEFTSESIEFKPEFAFYNFRTFQTMWGMFVAYDLKNTGNVDFDPQDHYGDDGEYEGPRAYMDFVDAYHTGSANTVFLDEALPAVKAGEEGFDMWPLDIPDEGYFKYGRLNATFEVRDHNDGKILQCPNIHMALEYPRYIDINEEIPLYFRLGSLCLDLKAGDSYDLKASYYTDADYFKDGTPQFVSSDPSVLTVTDGRITATGGGNAYLMGSVYPYGGKMSVYVTVEEEEKPAPVTPVGSGRSGRATYTVDVEDSASGGRVRISDKRPAEGETVTVTVEAADGYETESLIVTASNGDGIRVTKNEDGTYTFVQPSGNVTVTPVFRKLSGDSGEDGASEGDGEEKPWPFKDVPADAWYYQPIQEAFLAGRMVGTSEETFEPDAAITRGMFAFAVYRREGFPQAGKESRFEDVGKGSYYETAIAWANEHGIVKGYDETHYGPDDPITREQMAAILWRYAKYREYDVSAGEDTGISDFTDAPDVSEYAFPAVQWAVGDGVIKGFEDKTVRPKETATRAQLAVILNRIAELF